MTTSYDPTDLPSLIHCDIFERLSASDLHRARRVSKKWNAFIRDIIWRDCVSVYERRVRRNWNSANPEYKKSTYYIHLPFKVTDFLDVSDRYIVVTRYSDIELRRTLTIFETNIKHHSIENSTIWNIASLDAQNILETYILKNYLIVHCNSYVLHNVPRSVKVFSLTSHIQIFSQDIPYLHRILICPDQFLVILLERKYIRVLKLEDNSVTTPLVLHTEQLDFYVHYEDTFSKAQFPFILHAQFEKLTRLRRFQVFIWKINKDIDILENYFSCLDFQLHTGLLVNADILQTYYWKIKDIGFYWNLLFVLSTEYNTRRSEITGPGRTKVSLISLEGVILCELSIDSLFVNPSQCPIYKAHMRFYRENIYIITFSFGTDRASLGFMLNLNDILHIVNSGHVVDGQFNVLEFDFSSTKNFFLLNKSNITLGSLSHRLSLSRLKFEIIDFWVTD